MGMLVSRAANFSLFPLTLTALRSEYIDTTPAYLVSRRAAQQPTPSAARPHPVALRVPAPGGRSAAC